MYSFIGDTRTRGQCIGSWVHCGGSWTNQPPFNLPIHDPATLLNSLRLPYTPYSLRSGVFWYLLYLNCSWIQSENRVVDVSVVPWSVDLARETRSRSRKPSLDGIERRRWLVGFLLNTLAGTTSAHWKDWNRSTLKRRVEWNGSINSHECLLCSSHPRGTRHRRKGIKTIDRELVRARGIVRSAVS